MFLSPGPSLMQGTLQGVSGIVLPGVYENLSIEHIFIYLPNAVVKERVSSMISEAGGWEMSKKQGAVEVLSWKVAEPHTRLHRNGGDRGQNQLPRCGRKAHYGPNPNPR